ncbi:MAG: D-alanyl-D-alanine carboxypeptidase family protein [Cellulosilyticaceae bacterium]
MKKTYYFLLILLVSLGLSITAFAAPLPDISAEGAILMDAKTGTILYAKNINSVFYPASTTKVLSCLILAEEMDATQIITKTPASIANVPSDSSHIGLLRGDTYTVKDGLHGILMGSDNYISYDMAVKNAGSIDAFANKMNQRAKLLGARSSHFVNPHGYHDPNHYTTPYDLALITKAAFANPEVLESAGTGQYKFAIPNRSTTMDISHTAALLDQQSPYYNPHVVAAKTGYHTPAGRTLVAKAIYNDIELIGVVMKTNTPYQFKDMNALFNYGNANFKVVGNEDHSYRVENISYSSWSKPYVTYALEHNWIAPTTTSYQTPISERTFVSLLNKAIPNAYPLSDEMMQTSILSPSKINDPLSGLQASQILTETANTLVPMSPFNLVDSLGSQSLGQSAPLTLEQALCIIYKFRELIKVSPPYIFMDTLSTHN